MHGTNVKKKKYNIDLSSYR